MDIPVRFETYVIHPHAQKHTHMRMHACIIRHTHHGIKYFHKHLLCDGDIQTLTNIVTYSTIGFQLRTEGRKENIRRMLLSARTLTLPRQNQTPARCDQDQ